MKFFVVILAVIGIASCSLPTASDYDTANLRKVQICENDFNISDEEKQIWWSWEIPSNPKRCYIQCTIAAFGWIDKSGEINYDIIRDSYKAVGHEESAPSRSSIEATCGELPSDICDRSDKLYECLLKKSENSQHFKDAFDGKPNTA